ncbi:MAG: hypothetical protein ACPG6B_08565, partial [Oceanihabitans sp.]
MKKYGFTVLLILSFLISGAQNPAPQKDSTKTKTDSIKRRALIKQLGNGYFPTKYIDIDLRYLVKYNQYEALRTGIGGRTNNTFSEKIRFNTYVVYGFRDKAHKYSFGAGVRLVKHTNTWVNFAYTNDLSETGSSTFLTDNRFFQLFEPRLLNIDLFHKHITTSVSLEHQFTPHLVAESEFAHSKIDPTYYYSFFVDNKTYQTFNLSTSKTALQWSPFSRFEIQENKLKEIKSGYPKFTLQYTKSLRT